MTGEEENRPDLFDIHGRRICPYKVSGGLCDKTLNYYCIDCRRYARMQQLMLKRACSELAGFDKAMDGRNALSADEWHQYLICCALHQEARANGEDLNPKTEE